MKAVISCFWPRKGYHHRKQQIAAFFVACQDTYGAIIQPLMRLKRPIQINVASPACISWVSIPRGRENWSLQEGCTGLRVSLDKRELLSLVDNTGDILSTGNCSDA